MLAGKASQLQLHQPVPEEMPYCAPLMVCQLPAQLLAASDHGLARQESPASRLVPHPIPDRGDVVFYRQPDRFLNRSHCRINFHMGFHAPVGYYRRLEMALPTLTPGPSPNGRGVAAGRGGGYLQTRMNYTRSTGAPVQVDALGRRCYRRLNQGSQAQAICSEG